MTKRVAVIGAGPSGTAMLRAFQSAREKGAEIPEIVCFEKQEDWGGLWNYSWRTGTDENGEPVHCSMYRYLWSNGPKEGLEFADYTFEEHFGKTIASYPPREVLRDYIVGRMERAGVRPWCRFCTVVRNVTWDEPTQKFTVTAHDLTKKRTYSEEFDDVVVATGHFSTPNVPYFEGSETFPGRVMHAHDFRDALEFKGKDILVIGTSYSAEDIASQCHKYGCNSVIISHRTNPTGFNWPKSFSEKPLLQKVQGNTVTFKDGSTAKVDAIILCTGYLHYFPFLPDDLRLETKNRLWPLGLYKGCVWEKNPHLFYIGMQDQWYTFNMFDAQAWYARDVILGRVKLPSGAEMHAESAEWRRREEAIGDAHDAIVFQGEHVRDLIGLTDYPSFDIDGVNQAFFEWKDHKKQDIMNFRDNGYRSVMTGTMAPKHHTPWIEALDDSMAAYLREPAAPAKTPA